jgi:ribosomal protein S10
LEGKEPTIFNGDRARADEFMHELKLYQFLNSTAPVMTDPYRKVAHALTFIQGSAVAEWKRSVENWVMRRPIPTPPHVDVWEEFEQDFIQDWDDTNAHYKAAAELDKLKMEGSNIDHYITKFAELARKAQYHEDDPAVLEKFKHGLTVRLLEASMGHDQPANWEQWKLSTRKRQAILTSIEPHRQAFFAEKRAKKPFFSRNNKGEFNSRRGGPSNAMDTSASLSKAVTEADKERYKKEGRCFFCGAQGHVSRSCSKKSATNQKSTPAKMAAVTEEPTTTSVTSQTTTLTQEAVLNFLKDLPTDEYQQMAEAWGRLTTDEDFSQA